MDLIPEDFDLARNLMEYLPRGEGMFLDNKIVKDKTITSVGISYDRDKDGQIVAAIREGEPTQVYADINYTLKDGSKGKIEVCFSPLYFLTTFLHAKNDVSNQFEKELDLYTPEKITSLCKCVMHYVAKGEEIHTPNFVDSVLGMKSVGILWSRDIFSERKELLDYGDDESLVFQCEVLCTDDHGYRNTLILRVMPYEITLS